MLRASVEKGIVGKYVEVVEAANRGCSVHAVHQPSQHIYRGREEHELFTAWLKIIRKLNWAVSINGSYHKHCSRDDVK